MAENKEQEKDKKSESKSEANKSSGIDDDKAKSFFKYIIIFLLFALFLTILIKSCSRYKERKKEATTPSALIPAEAPPPKKEPPSSAYNYYPKTKPTPLPKRADCESTQPLRYLYFSPTTYLSRGDRDDFFNNDVERLQEFLNALGYRVHVDGIFGKETEEALKRFQRDYGLPADGILGPKTVRLINRIAAQRFSS